MKRKLIYLITMLFSITSMQAQEIAVRIISLQEAMSLALSGSKSVQVSKFKIENAEAKKNMTINAFLPNISVNAAYTRLSANIEPFTITIPGVITTELNPLIPNQYASRASVQQPIFAGLKNVYNLQASKAMLTATKLDSKKEEDDILINIIQQYYSFCKTSQSRKLLEDNMKTIDVRIRDIQNFKSVGMALQNDLLKAQLQKSNLELTLAEVDNASAVLNYNINLLLGLNEQTMLEPSPLDLVSSKSDAPVINFNPVYQDRADWMSLNFKILAGQKQVKSAQSAFFPTINAGFNFYYNNPNQRVFPQTAKFQETWDAGVTLNWNLSNFYTAPAAIRDAKVNTKINDLMLAQLQDGIRSEQYTLLKSYELSLQKISIAEKAIEQARENQRIYKNRYSASAAVLTDLLEADSQLLQAEINLINAQYDAKIAYYKYLKANGTISSANIK